MRSIGRMRMRGSLAAATTALLILASACSGEEGDASPPRGSPKTDPSPETIPDRLADGSSFPELPSAVTSAFDRPVVGAESVGGDHPLAEACLAFEQESASPEPFEGTLAGAYLSPFGGGVQFETAASTAGDEAGRAMLACDVAWRSGDVHPLGGGLHPWSDDHALAAAGGALHYGRLPEERTNTAFLSVPVPDDTAWLVHDRGKHLVAYPVVDGLPVRVSTPVDSTDDTLTLSVVYLDDEGERIDAEEVTGVVAG